jgi:hypothetical protein
MIFQTHSEVVRNVAGSYTLLFLQQQADSPYLNGANWSTLTQSLVIKGYIYPFQSPHGVAVDGSGRIYVADPQSPRTQGLRSVSERFLVLTALVKRF